MSAGADAEAHDAFGDVLLVLLFLAAAWASGKAANLAGMPPLVGEILLGALLGPPLGDRVPQPEGLKLVGEVGLVLMARACDATRMWRRARAGALTRAARAGWHSRVARRAA